MSHAINIRLCLEIRTFRISEMKNLKSHQKYAGREKQWTIHSTERVIVRSYERELIDLPLGCVNKLKYVRRSFNNSTWIILITILLTGIKWTETFTTQPRLTPQLF